MNNNSNQPDIPLGLGIALTQNPDAFTKFAALSNDGKLKIIEQTHSVNSKGEMRDFVDRLNDV